MFARRLIHCGDAGPRLCRGVDTPSWDAARAEEERRASDTETVIGANVFIVEERRRVRWVRST